MKQGLDIGVPVAEGTVLVGKYRVERVLGVGGVGVVVAAHHIQLDERVALKFLLPETSRLPDVVARFLREARAAVKIKSEHVARVTDVGTLEDGTPYMVMEYLEGQDLAVLIREQGRLPIATAVDYVLQACEAIAEAHTLGIVHRDLKPANLFLTLRADSSPCVKVLDFGISKVTKPGAAPEAAFTKSTTVIGSPLYMSPEQLQSSRNVDLRTDMWALGVILYELLTGQQPFTAETYPQLVAAIMSARPEPLERHRSDVPPGLVTAITRCLDKEPANRFANVAEVARAVAPYASKRGQVSAQRISKIVQTGGLRSNPEASPPSDETVVSGAPLATEGPTPASWGRTEPTARMSRTRRAVLWTGALALLVASVLVVGVYTNGNGDGAISSADTPAAVFPAALTVAEPLRSAVVPAASFGSAADAGVVSKPGPSQASAAPTVSQRAPDRRAASPETRRSVKPVPKATTGDGLFSERQ
jgi:eukaryotic-like serine/threonine-protein kinase